jgi:hypothetical protein
LYSLQLRFLAGIFYWNLRESRLAINVSASSCWSDV